MSFFIIRIEEDGARHFLAIEDCKDIYNSRPLRFASKEQAEIVCEVLNTVRNSDDWHYEVE